MEFVRYRGHSREMKSSKKMERVSEEAHSRRVRVFRWNEKPIKECDALLMFRITNKFITLHNTNETEEEIFSQNRVFHFDRIRLLADKYITSVIVNALKTTKQFLPSTVASLAPQISTYIISRFRFSPQNLLLRNLPKIVFVVDIDRTRTVLKDSTTDATDNSSLFPPRLPHCEYISESLIVAPDHQDRPLLNWEEDPELLNIMCSLSKAESYMKFVCEAVSDGGKPPREPIATDEPSGFFEVDPKSEHVWVRRTNCKDEAEAVVGECPICMDVMSTERREINMHETLCLHVFHDGCLNPPLFARNLTVC